MSVVNPWHDYVGVASKIRVQCFKIWGIFTCYSFSSKYRLGVVVVDEQPLLIGKNLEFQNYVDHISGQP
jgi:hypothetical protein